MLSTSEISHIARLARLRLDAEEERSLGADLSRVLGYIDLLDDLEITAPDEAHVGASAPSARPDVAMESSATEAFLRNAPKSLDRFLLVPAIK